MGSGCSVMSRHHRNTANITREQKMKNFTAAIILLLAGSGQAQFNFKLGQLFGQPAASTPSFSSPTRGQTTHTNSDDSETTCPPQRPCRSGSECSRPRCNRKGMCWCKQQDLFSQILNNTEVSIGSAAAGPDGIKLNGTTSACPPLPGVKPPPGCNKRFADGVIPCWDDTDCPLRLQGLPGVNRCQHNICNFPGSPGHTDFVSRGDSISYISPTGGVTTHTNSDNFNCYIQSDCIQTTCQPSNPCKSDSGCSSPTCNSRGYCWCGPRTVNNLQNTNNPLQDLFGKILDNTEISIGRDEIKLKAGAASACPPLLYVDPPPGCNKRFAEGLIPCGDDTDCPSPGTCQNDICSSTSTSAGFAVISYSSASFGPTESNSGNFNCNIQSDCTQTSCPPSRPCRRVQGCSRPICNRRGYCWCK